MTGPVRAAAVAWAGLLVLTALTALAVGAIPGAPAMARGALDLSFDPPPATVVAAAVIALRNVAALAPLIVGPPVVAWLGFGRRALDAVIFARVAFAVGAVGAAIGGYGVGVLPWLIHVPVEWAAIATSLAPYRHQGVTGPTVLARAGATGALVGLAAAIEVFSGA